MYSSIHSSEANFALGLLLDSCCSSCPLGLQAIERRWQRLLEMAYNESIQII